MGWWHAWQSNTTSSGKSPSRLRRGSSSTSSSSAAASAWPTAQTRTPSHSPLRAFQSASTTKCAGSVTEKVSSSKLMRGCPAPIMRCVTNLSRLPKWQERQSFACATGSSSGYSPCATLSACVAPGAAWRAIQSPAGPWHASHCTPSVTLKRSPRCAGGGTSPWQSRQTFARSGRLLQAQVGRDAARALGQAAPGTRGSRACRRATR